MSIINKDLVKPTERMSFENGKYANYLTLALCLMSCIVIGVIAYLTHPVQ